MVSLVVWVLIIGGVWMLLVEVYIVWLFDCDQVIWIVVIGVGLVQVVVGVFFGILCLVLVIFLVMLLGLSCCVVVVEFVFLVGIFIMFVVSVYIFLELVRDGQLGSENWIEVGVVFFVVVIIGFVVVKWLMGYIKLYRFMVFVFYCIVLGVVLLLWLFFGS